MTYCNHCGDNLVWFSIKPEYESMCILSLSMIVLSWDCRAREPKAEASPYRRAGIFAYLIRHFTVHVYNIIICFIVRMHVENSLL